MTTQFKIDIIQRASCLILRVEGELDIATAPMLDNALARAEATDAGSIIVDLVGLNFIDSSGLGVLIRHARSDQQLGRLRLRKGSPQIQRVFEISGTSNVLPFQCPE